jgi:uncharacterized protein (DUF2252 family)
MNVEICLQFIHKEPFQASRHAFVKVPYMSVLQRIAAFNAQRDPEIIPYKYKAMAENAFRYYRGTCHLFHEDISASANLPDSPVVWASGDLHLENFGSFRSDNRQVYFDINDFDEAALAPACWELARLVTSIFIGFRSLDIDYDRAENMAALCLKSYCETLKGGKADYIEARTAGGIVCEFLKAADRQRQKDILPKRTHDGKNGLRLDLTHPKHLKIKKPLKEALTEHIDEWLQQDDQSPYNYKVIDACFRLAGTGSLGVLRYELLLESSNDVGERYILIDMKQAAPASLVTHRTLQPLWQTEAERVVSIQRRMQNRPPALLSHTCFQGSSYIIQEMQPEKDSINFKLLRNRYRDMYQVIANMGMLTASAQLRSAGRQGSAIADELIHFAHNDGWVPELINYAKEYAGKVLQDYNLFRENTLV